MTPACQNCPSLVLSVHKLWGTPPQGTATSLICSQLPTPRPRAGSLLQGPPSRLTGPGQELGSYSGRPQRSGPRPRFSSPQHPRRPRGKQRQPWALVLGPRSEKRLLGGTGLGPPGMLGKTVDLVERGGSQTFLPVCVRLAEHWLEKEGSRPHPFLPTSAWWSLRKRWPVLLLNVVSVYVVSLPCRTNEPACSS